MLLVSRLVQVSAAVHSDHTDRRGGLTMIVWADDPLSPNERRAVKIGSMIVGSLAVASILALAVVVCI